MKTAILIIILSLVIFDSSGQCYTTIKTTGNNTFARMADGTLWGWGTNNSGLLGNGTTTPNFTKTQMGTENDWSENFAVGRALAAIKTNGTLWIWGCNNGLCGDGNSTSQYLFPHQIGNDIWKFVSSNGDNILAVKANGTLWAWGNNSYGQLGTGSSDQTPVPAPVQVGTDTDWSRVYATPSGETSYGIKENGSLWSWGSGSFHLLGYASGPVNSTLAPYMVDGGSWLTIAAEQNHVMAVKANGTLWGWGNNSVLGSYGNGNADTHNYQLMPVQIGTGTQWKDVVTNLQTTAGLQSDGTLWGWGVNNAGQVGDGTTIVRYSPIQLGNDNDWLSLSGHFTNYAVKTSYSLYKWGYNYDIGTTSVTSTPTLNATACTLGNNKWQTSHLDYFYEGTVLHIRFPGTVGNNVQMDMANELGQILVQKKINEGANEYAIDMGNYSSGLYLFVFSDGLSRFNIKYIKQ